jgi:glycosyltransferase involved in cell wall biosynthesis
MANVIIVGPAHPLRGGLASFDHRLAREFTREGDTCSICSFSLQYPSFLFPGKSQYTADPPPEGLLIRSWINSINPFNWQKVGKRLAREKPDLVVVRFWLPLMGPALGTILRKIRKNNFSKILCIADNISPHEKRPGDKSFTRYFLGSCDGFITMSEKVMKDLRSFEKTKPARIVTHPLYDTFGDRVSKEEARTKLGLPQGEKIILFFGFIRKYKGLDLLLHAMQKLEDVKLIVAGEFYEDEKGYKEIIEKTGIRDKLILRTDFIPDNEVKYYLCAADAVVQPYRNATQSGVTPLAYHFERPMIVTNVGGLPDMVPDGKAGIVTKPDADDIAAGIERFYQLGEQYFIPQLRMEKQKYSWSNLVHALRELAAEIQKPAG